MSWQDEFRQLFPITRDKAYANIAYTSPLSPKVADAVAQFLRASPMPAATSRNGCAMPMRCACAWHV